jgi:hypothetical protein
MTLCIAQSRLSITAGWQILGRCNFPAAVEFARQFHTLSTRLRCAPILIKLRAHSLTNAGWLC